MDRDWPVVAESPLLSHYVGEPHRALLSRRFVMTAACGAILSACGRGAEDEGPRESGVIRFAILEAPPKAPEPISDDDRWSAVFSDLKRATGLSVKPWFVVSAAALVESMHRRRVDLALMPSAPALAAVRRADGEVFARVLAAEPAQQDAAVLLVGPKSRLTLDQVLKCDRTVSLGIAAGGRDEALYAADAFLFAAKGMGPSRCFREVRRTAPAAILGDLNVQKLDTAILEAPLVDSDRQLAGVRQIWRSPPLPSPSLVWRRDLDPAIKEKLRQFFLTYGQDDAAERRNLAALGLAGFAPADSSHLLVEREMDAAHAWLEAKASGETARADLAKRDLDAIAAERQDLEARTGTPAGAQ